MEINQNIILQGGNIMNKVLDFVTYYVIYLVVMFLGFWIGSLFIGVNMNPFTNWIPYVIALPFALSEVISREEK